MSTWIVFLMTFGLFGSVAFAGSEDSSRSVAAEAQTNGTVRPGVETVALGVAPWWGQGRLNYESDSKKFRISDVSLVDSGPGNLSPAFDRLSNSAGNYVTLSAGATVAGDEAGLYFRKDRGVVMKRDGATKGLKFVLSTEGVSLMFKW